MTEELPETNPPTPKSRGNASRIVKWVIGSVLGLLLVAVIAVGIMAGSDRGSKWLLDLVLNRQEMIHYEYSEGNLLRGIILKNILVTVDETEVKIDQADINLGWRALVNREIHLMRAKVGVVQVINHAPPKDEEFNFKELKLPFSLRLDESELDELVIQTTTSKVNLYDIKLNDAYWSGSKIELKDSSMRMDFLSVNAVTGFIELNNKYPLSLDAELKIPALDTFNAGVMKVLARGDIDTLTAGVALSTPDIISGYVVAHPVRKDVPMFGKLSWSDLNVPIAKEQELFSKLGEVKVSGDITKLNFLVDTDFVGKNIPEGNYTADLSTDLKQLQIEKFVGHLMGGQVDLHGYLDWQNGIDWDVQGTTSNLNRKNPNIPEDVQGFLPADMGAKLSSKGSLNDSSDILATVNFNKYERWDVKLHQDKVIEQKIQPWAMNIAWKDINREMPYIGWLNSQSGNVDLKLSDASQNVRIETNIAAHEQTTLPQGHYFALVDLEKNILKLNDFVYSQGESKLQGKAIVNLPTEKTQLKWNASLKAQKLNPQSITTSAPVNRIDGSLLANGYAEPNKQVIQLKSIDMTGYVQQGKKTEQITLKGNSTAAILLHNGQSQSGLKGFAVQYDGHLNAQGYSQGPLKLNVSGTPQLININQLYHDGAAGKINAKGVLNISNGLSWDVRASLDQLKPHYFISSVQGNISGQVNTKGKWSDQQKYLSVQNMNLTGNINNKPLLGRGNLSLAFGQSNQLMPTEFEANNLVLSYANNVIHASGNSQRLQLNVNAPNLTELHPSVRGTVKGFISLQSQPQVYAQSNLIAQNIGYSDLINIEQISLIGTLPTGSQTSKLAFNVNNLSSGKHGISSIKAELIGTKAAHVLRFNANNNVSTLSTQLAGGFNAQNDWYGQIQKGNFDSQQVSLVQDQAASVIYKNAATQFMMTAHCWSSKKREQTKICIDQPLSASKDQGAASFSVKEIELGDFRAFMPTGLGMSGKLNGYSQLSWAKNQPMNLDAQFITQKGVIGLASDDARVDSSSLSYNELALRVKTLSNGLSIKFNADTPLLGKGYANALVGIQGEDKPISGEIALSKIKLNIFKPFIADLRTLDGELSAAGKLDGTLKNPLFNGEIRLKDGKLAMMSIPLSLQNIQVASSIRGSQMVINGGFNAGRGVGKITGNANWANSPSLKLNISGKELLVSQPPLVSAAVSPDINIDMQAATKQLIVNGKIDIPLAVVSMPESSAEVVASSADVRVVQRGESPLALINASKPWNIRADISVALGDKVSFRGFNSVMPLIGRLNLTQRGTEIAMRANGAIGVSRQVKIEAYGQSLNLNRAIARFGGELSNPTLDIDATKDVQNSTVGIRVTGRAERPDIQIYNDAGLSEQEALNALLTGRISNGSSGLNNTEGFKSDVNNTIAAAGISMGLGGTRAFTNQIGRTFGLSGLALDAQGSGDDTQVSVTGYITPDLYLRYGVGIFTPINTLTLRYQMNRRLYLEASSSVERAVDVFYNWRF